MPRPGSWCCCLWRSRCWSAPPALPWTIVGRCPVMSHTLRLSWLAVNVSLASGLEFITITVWSLIWNPLRFPRQLLRLRDYPDAAVQHEVAARRAPRPPGQRVMQANEDVVCAVSQRRRSAGVGRACYCAGIPDVGVRGGVRCVDVDLEAVVNVAGPVYQRRLRKRSSRGRAGDRRSGRRVARHRVPLRRA